MDRIWIYAAIAFGVWIVRLVYKITVSPLRAIPGPVYTNLSRLPLQLSIITGQRIYFIHKLHRTYGSIVRLGPDEVSISSLPDLKEIHRPGSGFLKTEWYEKFVMGGGGGGQLGVFAMRNVRQHAERPRLLARVFIKSELRSVWEGVVKSKVHVAVGKMKGEMEGGGKCDVLKWWTFLATDVAGHLMFGEDFGMLDIGEKNEYIHVLESTMKGSGITAELSLAGFIGRHLPIASMRSMFRAGDYLTSYGRRAPETSLTELDVVTEAGNLIVAGSDTTAVTLTYLVWAVLKIMTTQNSNPPPSLNAVIKETIRLYGAAPGTLPRSVPEGGATLAGYYIPEGTTVGTQSFTIHRDPEIYANPEVFDISRWLDNKGNSPAQTAFSPFGAGARACLGIHLAYMELRLSVAEFFRMCCGVKLAGSVTRESMEFENYFLIAPRGHRCEVIRGN
ncbi:hypothetical protein BDV12DRAFT_206172 [Aspergillus spectabilis]